MKRALLWVVALALVAGCRAPRPLATATPQPTPTRPPTATPVPGARETPAPTPTSTPLPVAASDLNILLLGSDHRIEAEPTWRTDTIILVAIRPRARLVAMLSIPRDLWVEIPGYGYERINVADYLGEKANGRGGGPALVAQTLRQNLGLMVDASARINFDGLGEIIDTLGGISITSDRAYDEWFWDEEAQGGVSHMRVVTGTQRMDGRLALMYARARHGTSDFDRSRRQQQILLAVRDAALRPEILPRLPALLRQLSDTVDTDLRPGQVLSLAGLALRLGPGSYRGRVFDATMVRDWTTPAGAMVLLPDRARIEEVWAEMTGAGS